MNKRPKKLSSCDYSSSSPIIAVGRPWQLRISRLCLVGACSMAALLGPAAKAPAVATFDAKLETSLTLNNRKNPIIDFIGTFPKPDPTDNTKTQPKTGPEPEIKVGKTGITAHIAKGDNQYGLGKPSFLPKTMELQAAGWASANGSIAELALWASGYQEITLINRSGFDVQEFGNSRKIDFDFTFDATGLLSAVASNDPQEVDFARAQLLYRVLDVETGSVLMSAGESVADVMNSIVASEGESKSETPSLNKNFTVTVPGGKPKKSTKYKLGVEAYVYGRGLSIAAKDDLPDDEKAKQDEAKKAFHQGLDEVYPDPAMRLRPEANTLTGEATGHGPWQLDSVAGVSGSDELAHHGLDTIFLSQTATTLGQPFDVEITLEVPPEGASQAALESSLFAPMDVFGRDYRLAIGTGVGDDFRESTDLESMALFGTNSELAPQVLAGEFAILGADDMLVSSVSGNIGVGPGSELTTLLVANIVDGADGIVDGIATFTLRQLLTGNPGDYNGDGLIDSQDYVVWRSDFGTLDGRADGNGDGIVDAADYVFWRSNLGTGLNGVNAPRLASRAEAIPEPSPAVLMMIALCLAVPAYRTPRLGYSVDRVRGSLSGNSGRGIIYPIRRREAEGFWGRRASGTDNGRRTQ
jgi:hypothetical protein